MPTTVSPVGNSLDGAWRVYQFKTTGGPVTLDIVSLSGTTGTVSSAYFTANELALMSNLAKALLANIAPGDIAGSVSPILSRLVGTATLDGTALNQTTTVAGALATLQVTVAANQYFAVYIPNEASGGFLFSGGGSGGGGASGAAGGDLTGTYPNPQVAALTGAIAFGAPTGVINIRYGSFVPVIPATLIPEDAPAGSQPASLLLSAGFATATPGAGGGSVALVATAGTDADAVTPGGNGGTTDVGFLGFGGFALGGKGSATQAPGDGGDTRVSAGFGGEAVTGGGAGGAGGDLVLVGGWGGFANAGTGDGENGGDGGGVIMYGGLGGASNATGTAGQGGGVEILAGNGGIDGGGGGAQGGVLKLGGGTGSIDTGATQTGLDGWTELQGRVVTPPASNTPLDITGAVTLTPGAGNLTGVSGFVPFEASGGGVTFGAGYGIDPGEDGEELLFVNTDAANTVTFTNAATNLRVGNAGSRAVDPGGYLRLLYVSSLSAWTEVGYNQASA